MARMRSLKPEFWTDEEIADLPRDGRLLYMGLWNLADEHGRLRGDARYVKGQLFPYDDDLAAADIDHLLDLLAKANKAIRYRIDGKSYIYLPKLAKHQRLEPDKVPSRLPAPPSEKNPDESARDANELPLKHVAGSREHVAGSRWQEREARAAQTAERGADEPPPDSEPGPAEKIVAEWIASLPKPPQQKIVDEVGKWVRTALHDGQDRADVAEAVKLWQAKGNLGPGVIPSLIHQVATAPPAGTTLAIASRASPIRESTTDARMRQGQALIAEFEAMEARQ